MISTSLFRNVFTDLKNPSLDKLKQPFTSSISQSANCFAVVVVVVHVLSKKKKNGEEPFRRSKVTLPFCLTYSLGLDFFMPSPNISTFGLLLQHLFILLSHLSVPLKFFKPLQLHSSSHNGKICMRIPGSTLTLLVNNRKCSHAKQAVQTKSVRL